MLFVCFRISPTHRIPIFPRYLHTIKVVAWCPYAYNIFFDPNWKLTTIRRFSKLGWPRTYPFADPRGWCIGLGPIVINYNEYNVYFVSNFFNYFSFFLKKVVFLLNIDKSEAKLRGFTAWKKFFWILYLGVLKTIPRWLPGTFGKGEVPRVFPSSTQWH